MADKKNRTNWSDKARRITGGVTLGVIILIILLCVLLGKKNKSVEPEPIVQPTPVVTEVKEEKKQEPVTVVKEEPKEQVPVIVEEVKEPEILVEEPVVPVVEEPIKEIIADEEPKYTTGEVSFDVCGITVKNSWSDGLFVSTSNAKERFSKEDVMAFVRYEADKYLSYMDEETVLKIIASTGTIKIEYPSTIDPEILMPYYKNDIEEYATLIAPVEEIVEEPVEEAVVEEPAIEEVVPMTADFTVFGYKVLNSWVPGTFTSVSETKGLLYESDVMGFAQYEIGKYGDFLLENVAIEFIPDGFVLTYPEAVDPSPYIAQYKSDIEEYVATLFTAVEVVEEPAPVEEPAIEGPVAVVVPSVISGYEEFKIMGFVVENTWNDGSYLAETAINGILTEDDIKGFVLYEIAKYGSFLTDNVAVKYTADGFMLSIPKDIDPSPYIPVFKSDIEEYIAKLFAPVEEIVEEPVEEAVVEEPAIEEVVPMTADFTVFGYKVLNSWVPGTFTSVSETKGLLYESDVMGFAQYEIGKYGDFLLENVAIEFIPDGFVLTYPEAVDPSPYIAQYKSDIEEYVATLFTAVEVVEEPAPVEEPAVEEPVVPTAPLEPVAVDVPKPAEVVEVVVSPKADKLSSYKFKLGVGFGPEFGINNKVDYVTIFPRLAITADFQNVFTVSKVGFGARLDLSGVFKPLDGTFIGHEFKFFLNGNNWAVDAMIDAKLMAYVNLNKVQLYVGGGIGYSIGSHNLYMNTHTRDNMVFGFDTATALSAVVGLDWNISEKFSLTLEG
ncbi:MAG: hypothetical protein ACI4SI_04445, partial [Candidatus Ornithospirochaeta sp.]